MEKQYVDTPFNYTGSKFKLLPQLLPNFDYTKKHFVDAFGGGGSVWTNVVDKYDYITVNDIIKDLILTQQTILEQGIGGQFIQNVKNLSLPTKTSQEAYSLLRESYNTNPTPEKFYALILSCTNNMMRFNKKFGFNQTWGKRCFNDSTEQKIIKWVSHLNSILPKVGDDVELPHLKFYSDDFDILSPVTNFDVKNMMFYFDPPYGFIKEENGNMSGKQISEAGYNAYWTRYCEMDLYYYCHEIDKNGGSFCVSGVLEHDGKVSYLLDRLVNQDGFNVKYLDHNYAKVSRKVDGKNTKEVIVFNY